MLPESTEARDVVQQAQGGRSRRGWRHWRAADSDGTADLSGQPLSLLCKQNPDITELVLYDVVPVVKGVAVDISHISTPSVVTAYTRDDDGLNKALHDADIVVVPAGARCRPAADADHQAFLASPA